MSTADASPAPQFTSVTNDFVVAVQRQMVAFAQSQLGDYHLAEDVVQDALMAALQHGNQFKGEAAFKSWVFAILKNKISDCIRKNCKYTNIGSLHGYTEDNEETLMDALFDEAGSWYPEYKPSQFNDSWCDPQQQAYSDGFWQILETCLTNLPGDQAQAFLMREYVELDSSEICQALKISSSHYYVLMHRARLRLQTCLTIRWFENDED